jgi:CheY-like chemotaxis protein
MRSNIHRPRSGFRCCRVLIVEDELLLALELQSLLESLGCEVIGPVPSVPRTLQLLARERPDLALLDVNLGGRSVAPVAAALKLRGIPYVLVTGYNDLDAREPGLRDAARIDKPVNRRRLLQVLAQMAKPAS